MKKNSFFCVKLQNIHTKSNFMASCTSALEKNKTNYSTFSWFGCEQDIIFLRFFWAEINKNMRKQRLSGHSQMF